MNRQRIVDRVHSEVLYFVKGIFVMLFIFVFLKRRFYSLEMIL